MNSLLAARNRLWRPYYNLQVRGDEQNLPSLLVCPRLSRRHAVPLCRRLGCRLLRAGNAPAIDDAVYLGDMDADGIKQLLRQIRENPHVRWCVVMESAPMPDNQAVKFDRQAAMLVAQIKGVFAPLQVSEDGRRLGRPILTVHLGRHHQLPADTDPRALSRHLAAALESCVAEAAAENIPRAFVGWGEKHGWARPLFLDFAQPPLSYRHLYRTAWALGAVIAARHTPRQRIGVLLPSSAAAAATFYAAVFWRLPPVMLNLSAGAQNVLSACHTAGVDSVYTSQKLLEQVPAAAVLAQALREHGIQVVCLETLRPHITWRVKLRAALAALLPGRSVARLPGAAATADEAAAVLFTSGSEGRPKGVVLSHRNLLTNAAQVLARLDSLPGEKMLNSLPVFHSFGLLAGVLLPAAGGITAMQYPSPLHYRQIADVIYRFRPAIFFSADTFLTAYAREAHPLDMASLRYVFAGAEKLRESTRRRWAEKFGVRVLEGYGVTESSPVISVNAPGENRTGTVGRPLANIATRLTPVPGVTNGGQLSVRGANIMLGYFMPDEPGVLQPPPGGWHDTGDIAEIDDDGFLRIRGRARRFIKVAGEMVPLDGVEEALRRQWPDSRFAVVSIADDKRGEQIVALSDNAAANREAVAETFKQSGLPPLWIPRRIIIMAEIPQLPTGKTDYPAAAKIAAAA